MNKNYNLVNICYMKRLNKLQIQFIINELENCKTNKKSKIRELSHFFARPCYSISSYYYRYKCKKSLTLHSIIDKLSSDIENTPYIYSIKAEKGKVRQYRVRLNMTNLILRTKKRQPKVLLFPAISKISSEYDIAKVLAKLSNMVRNQSISEFNDTKLKVVKNELNKYKLNTCKSNYERENILKQNLCLKAEVEKLKDKIRELRSLNLDKKE